MLCKAVITALTLVLLLSACGLKDELERRVEEQASQAVTDAMNVAGGSYMGQDIPEGFPEDLFPVYGGSDSQILVGSRTDIDGKLLYHLVLGTDHDQQTVETSLREALDGLSPVYEEIPGPGLLIGTAEGWRFSIVINDGAADNFATVVAYNLEEL